MVMMMMMMMMTTTTMMVPSLRAAAAAACNNTNKNKNTVLALAICLVCGLAQLSAAAAPSEGDAVCEEGDPATCGGGGAAAAAASYNAEGVGQELPSESEAGLAYGKIIFAALFLPVLWLVVRMYRVTMTVELDFVRDYWRFHPMYPKLRIKGMQHDKIFMYVRFTADAEYLLRKHGSKGKGGGFLAKDTPHGPQNTRHALGPAAPQTQLSGRKRSDAVLGKQYVFEESFDPPLVEGSHKKGELVDVQRLVQVFSRDPTTLEADSSEDATMVGEIAPLLPNDPASKAAANPSKGQDSQDDKSQPYDKDMELCIPKRFMNACLGDAPPGTQVQVGFVVDDDPQLQSLDRDALTLRVLPVHPTTDSTDSTQVVRFLHENLMENLNAELDICRSVGDNSHQRLASQVLLRQLRQLRDMTGQAENLEHEMFILRDLDIPCSVSYAPEPVHSAVARSSNNSTPSSAVGSTASTDVVFLATLSELLPIAHYLPPLTGDMDQQPHRGNEPGRWNGLVPIVNPEALACLKSLCKRGAACSLNDILNQSIGVSDGASARPATADSSLTRTFHLNTSEFAHEAVTAVIKAAAQRAANDSDHAAVATKELAGSAFGRAALPGQNAGTEGTWNDDWALRLVFLMNENEHVGGKAHEEPAGAYLSSTLARVYVPTPEIVPLTGMQEDVSTPPAPADADEHLELESARSTGALPGAYYVGGAVQCVWLRSFFDTPTLADSVGIALCLLHGTRRFGTETWERLGDPVPLANGTAASEGGLDARRSWTFRGESSPRSKGLYRVELFFRESARADWQSVYQSANHIVVEPVPLLQFCPAPEPAPEQRKLGSAGAPNAGVVARPSHEVASDHRHAPKWQGVVGTPFTVAQALPKGLGADVENCVALYRIASAHEDQLRKAMSGPLQPAIDKLDKFEQSIWLSVVSAMKAMKAVDNETSAAAPLKLQQCVPIDVESGCATLTGSLPGFYVAAYKQVLRKGSSSSLAAHAASVDKVNAHHLLDVLKNLSTQSIFLPAPVIRSAGSGLRQGPGSNAAKGTGAHRDGAVEEVFVRMGDPLSAQILRMNKKVQKGDIVLQYGTSNLGGNAPPMNAMDERWAQLRSAAGKAETVLAAETSTVVEGLQVGCYSAVLCSAVQSCAGSESRQANEMQRQCCSIFDFEVGMFHNPLSTIAEALQFQKDAANTDATGQATSPNQNRLFSAAASAPTTWTEVARQPVRECESTDILVAVASPAWFAAVRAMQHRIQADAALERDPEAKAEPEWDAVTRAEFMDDLSARLAAVGIYAEKNGSDGCPEYIHESGRFVMRRVVDLASRTAHWQIIRQSPHDDSDEVDDDVEEEHLKGDDDSDRQTRGFHVALRSVRFNLSSVAEASSTNASACRASMGTPPFKLAWEMADIDTGEWVPCGAGTEFRVVADADDATRPPSSCRVTFDRNSSSGGNLLPGSYRMVYVEDGLPFAVSCANFVVRKPQLVARSQPPSLPGPSLPRRMRAVGTTLSFCVDGHPFDAAKASLGNLSVHVLKRTGTASSAGVGIAGAGADPSSEADPHFLFEPRIDFIRGNASKRKTTICVRLLPHQPLDTLGEDFVALFPFPLPGSGDTTQFIPGTERTVAEYASHGGHSTLQHGCLCLVPLWHGLSGIQLEVGEYVAAYVRKPKAQGMLGRVTGLFRTAEQPSIASVSGQFLRVQAREDGRTDITIEENPHAFRPPLDPLGVYDPVARAGAGTEAGDAPELDDQGNPSRDGLLARHLVLYRDDIAFGPQPFEAVPAFMERHQNLYVAIRGRSKAGIRRFDLVQFQPPSGNTEPARVRRALSLRTLAKLSQFEAVSDADWLPWHSLSTHAGDSSGNASFAAQVRRIGEVAFVGASTAVSALHGRTVSVAGDTRLYPLGANEDGSEFLAFAPRTMELLWVSSTDRLTQV